MRPTARRRGSGGGGGACRHGHQGTQPGDQTAGNRFGIAGQDFVLLQRVDPGADLIQRIKQPIDHPGGERQPPGPHLTQQILRPMHEPGQRRRIEQAGRSLDGVDGAEYLVDQCRIAGIALQPQQAGGGGLQQVAGFRHEAGEQRVHGARAPASAPPVSNWPVSN